MQQKEDYQTLIYNLKSAIGLLNSPIDAQLKNDVIAMGEYYANPIFRIAVFAPFNYGKSTLLNALLGERTLPIDIIPTTGAAIYVKYGEVLKTKIVFTNGREISETGTEVLKQYAILDDRRYMRDDVASVEVFSPHPFLKTGIEFLDLPGTNDREAQDKLVKEKLLTTDLIIQVLDARKLMTLGEREQLRDWLLDRGINSVIFVVNFLNLLEPNEQKEVQYRLRFVAESFRADLPPGVSNLYRVDALPALRARLKGDAIAVQTTGLSAFESALQTIVQYYQDRQVVNPSRLQSIVKQIQSALLNQKQIILAEIETQQQKQQTTIELNQKAEKLIKQGFQKSLYDFYSWLYLPNLLTNYQTELAKALQQQTFQNWENGSFKETFFNFKMLLEEWVKKGCKFFNHSNFKELKITFPELPQVIMNSTETQETTSINFPSQLNWTLKNPVGAVLVGGASYILHKATNQLNRSETFNHPTPLPDLQACEEAAKNYLTHFSEITLATLRQYELSIDKLMSYQPTQNITQTTASYQLQLLDSILQNLEQAD